MSFEYKTPSKDLPKINLRVLHEKSKFFDRKP